MNKNKIAVLISTYNGAKYLGQQLDSIVNQKFDQGYYYDIYIRDDGSSDNTQEIITNYCETYENIHFIKSYENMGVKKSFINLLADIDADLYFFSDQDDIWHDKKVKNFLHEFKKLNNLLPGIIYSELDLIDKYNNPLQKTMGIQNNWSNRKDEITITNLLLGNRVTGASMAVNKEMHKIIKEVIININFNDIVMHDALLCKIAMMYNNILFINEPLTKYRQHENNIIGALNSNKKIKLTNAINLRINEYKKIFYEINLIVDSIDRKNYSDKRYISLKDISLINNKNNLIVNLFLKNNVWKEVPFRKRITILFLANKILNVRRR